MEEPCPSPARGCPVRDGLRRWLPRASRPPAARSVNAVMTAAYPQNPVAPRQPGQLPFAFLSDHFLNDQLRPPTGQIVLERGSTPRCQADLGDKVLVSRISTSPAATAMGVPQCQWSGHFSMGRVRIWRGKGRMVTVDTAQPQTRLENGPGVLTLRFMRLPEKPHSCLEAVETAPVHVVRMRSRQPIGVRILSSADSRLMNDWAEYLASANPRNQRPDRRVDRRDL